ncbi:cold-shock protein [Pseudomonas graminis]
MNVVTGTVKSYDPQTHEGLIVVDGEGEEVFVDRLGAKDVELSAGLKVELQMIHRPSGVYASSIKLK